MKRFITIFCSALMISSALTTAYAAPTMGWRLSKDHRKYEWVNLTQPTIETTTKKPAASVETTTKKPTTSVETTTETTTAASTSTTTNNTQTDNTQAAQVLALVNKERAKENLAPLKLNTALTKVAQLKSEDMKNKNYFNHTSPTYGSPFAMMQQFGINYKYAGENIAKGQKTAEAVVTAWMNSEGHRKNIMNKNFTEMGLGYVKSGSTTYWTQMFIQQ